MCFLVLLKKTEGTFWPTQYIHNTSSFSIQLLIFRLFPHLGYCKQCCNEHQGALIFLNYGFLWIYAQEWDCWIIYQLYFQFSEGPPYCFSIVAIPFTIPPTVQEGSLFSIPSPAFIICRLFNDGYSDHCEVVPHHSFDLHFSNSQRH